MGGEYYIDLKQITLSEYETELEQAELIPSRKMLKEDLQKRFSCLKDHGINHLDDLLTALKTPDKIKRFALKTGLPEEYLTILKREIASSQPKPVNLIDFPGISKDTTDRLAQLGIKNTLQLFQFVRTEPDRKTLSEKTEIPYHVILELTRLTDVARIKWVGANFARLLVDSKCNTVDKVAKADYRELYDEVIQINEEKQYFKGKFGLNDMKLCVMAARNVPDAIRDIG